MDPADSQTEYSVPPAWQQRGKRLLYLMFSWGLAIGLAVIAHNFIFQSYRVDGQSMQPTLTNGDFLIISKIGSSLAELKGQDYLPERGDIVVLNSPTSQVLLIKRVIGLPGEHIEIRDGQVTITNAAEPDGFDPYQRLGLGPAFTAHSISLRIPEGHVFVIGDHRESGGSSDSRNDFGPVDIDLLIGKTVLRLWPLDTARTF